MKTVITGGAGFIGCNVAAHAMRAGHQVVVLDNLARPGAGANAQWLSTLDGDLSVIHADVRDYQAVRAAVRDAEAVYHLAAQVAVTTSVIDPRSDFEINALGTLNVLEAVRAECPGAFLAYSSTNKVYGSMQEVGVQRNGTRYEFANLSEGIGETQLLDFHSPYGCSKGAGDQYVRDYSRIYGLRTVVFRQSCIYGPHQVGSEDQGWVAHLMIQALRGDKIVIYGDGLQVRDILHVDDLIACYSAAHTAIDAVSGEVFNIGGGPLNTLSLVELIAYLQERLGRPIEYEFAPWRAGDQRVYVSNLSKARDALRWKPAIGVTIGLDRLMQWLRESDLARSPRTAAGGFSG
jgi:CDP-paratose 2-epimerase